MNSKEVLERVARRLNPSTVTKERRRYHNISKSLIYTPITEGLSLTVHNQYEIRCRDFEQHLSECVEAYGFYKGLEKCEAIIHDFEECMFKEKRRCRFEIVSGEFARQVEAGERSYEKAPYLGFF